MNQFLKRAVAFAVAFVMILGAVPAQAMAASGPSASSRPATTAEGIRPFTGTDDLIAQVKTQLLQQGTLNDLPAVDQDAAEAVEQESDYTFSQAMTAIAAGLFDRNSDHYGEIDVSYLNLSEETMDQLIEAVCQNYYLQDSVETAYETEDGIVTAVHFTMADSYQKILDTVSTADRDTVMVPAVQKPQTAVHASNRAAEKPFPFTDVEPDRWSRPYINDIYQKGLVNGVSATRFGPEESMTRAMVVTILWRMEGQPKPTEQNIFPDIIDKPENEWYLDAVEWAREQNVVNGFPDGTFRPDANVTREELVVIMHRFAGSIDGKDVSARGDLNMFADAGKIGQWAAESVQWSVAVKVINGTMVNSKLCFVPQGNATREQFAKIVCVYLDLPDPEKPDPHDPSVKHDWIHVSRVEPTCQDAGNIEYWYCTIHNRYFADEALTKEITKAETVLPKLDHHVPQLDADGNCADAVFHWEERSNGIIVDAQGNVSFDDSIYFTQNGQPITDTDGSPDVVGFYLDGNPILSITLTLNPETNEISFMPTLRPDYWIDFNDLNGDGKMTTQAWVDKNEDGVQDQNEIVDEVLDAIKNPEKLHHADTFVCATVTYKCAHCGAEATEEVEVTPTLMSQAWIEEQAGMAAHQAAEQYMTDYMTQKTQEYYEQNGRMPSEELQKSWQEDPETQEKMENAANQAAYAKAMELAPNTNTTIYTATSKHSGLTDVKDATYEHMMKSWGIMRQFNAAFPQYMGIAAPYWTSKNTEANPMDAVIYMCNAQEQPFVPNYNMEFMCSMLTQAFMSYVYSYGPMIDAMVADAMAVVNHEGLDEMDKMLLLHDWVAKYGTFDMQSMIDQTDGTSSGSDPIAMTIFGTLLRSQIPMGAPNPEKPEWDGAVCLGYTATYAILLQKAFEKTPEDAPIVDFVQIKYLCNVAETSVASGQSGFGDGDAMFNSPHFFNAVNYKGDWFYVDTCYDDVNIEVISQYRVETDGNVSHDNFMLSPLTLIDMYEGNFQFIDSLYDGKEWNRVPDGQGGYKMKAKLEGEWHVYDTEQQAQGAKQQAETEGKTLQLFYEYVATENDEKVYDNPTYEEAWFVHANGPVTYDPETQYFYYASSMINSYSSMKDLFEDQEGEGGGDGPMGDMDMEDMIKFKDNPASQDRLVRRPVDAPNEPEKKENNNPSFSQTTDPEAETFFHFGYGSVGAAAQKNAEKDNNMSFNQEGVDEKDRGPYYDLCQEDKALFGRYPDMTHSMVVLDGKLYFSIGHSIYTFNKTIAEMNQDIKKLTDLELVKVKEYDEISYVRNSKRFAGMSFVAGEKAENNTLRYRPIAAMDLHNTITWDADHNRIVTPTLFVSIATNFSNSFVDEQDQAYTIEAQNFNPNYFRFNDEEEEDANDNVEFMWCANVVHTMAVDKILAELTTEETVPVSVAPFCERPGFTEVRSPELGLTRGEAVVNEEAPAAKHNFVFNETENAWICTLCGEVHTHEFTGETTFHWGVNEEGALICDSTVACADEFCNVEDPAECSVEGPDENGVYTATSKYGDLAPVQDQKTADQVKHTHTYGDPVFNWNEDHTACTATFTCTGSEDVCLDLDGKRVEIVDCEVEKVVVPDAETQPKNPDIIAKCSFGGQEYSDTYHMMQPVVGSDEWAYTPAAENDDGTNGTMNCTYMLKCLNCSEQDRKTVPAAYNAESGEWTVTVDGVTFTHKHELKETEHKDANCTEPGVVTQECTCGYKHTEELPVEPDNHEMKPVADSAKWAYTPAAENDDGTNGTMSCTYVIRCAHCEKEEELTKQASYNAETKAWTLTVDGMTFTHSHADNMTETNREEPNCTETGSVTTECTCGYEHTEELPVDASKHDYGEYTYEWKYDAENDKMTCTAVRVCSRNEAHLDKAALTVTENEDGSFTAASADGKLISDHTHEYNTDGVCKCGHKQQKQHEHVLTAETEMIGDPKWELRADGTIWCTVTYTCTECKEQVVETQKAVKTAEDDGMNGAIYTAYFGANDFAVSEYDGFI